MTTQGFPLPLTPFERYMVLDGRPDYPMTFLAQMEFDGEFRKDLLERAMISALERHPMLRTTVHGRRTWREPVPAAKAGVIRWLPWSDEMPGEAFARIDIGREVGVRLFAQQQAGRSRLTLESHHAAVDGRGAGHFMWEIGAAYAAAMSGSGAEPAWGSADPELLRQRGEPRRAEPVAAPSASPAPAASATPPLSEMLGFVLRRPVHVRARRASKTAGRDASKIGTGAGAAPSPPVVSHTFDAAAFDRIRRTARARDASVNDVFLSALFQTIAEWNAPAAPYHGGGWLRIMVPTDLRTRDDVEIGATNVLGFGFLDRRARDCGDAAALLLSVRDEMQSMRLNRIGHRILDSFALLDRVPGLLRLVLWPRVTLSTVVFSNIGRVGARLPGSPGRGPDKFGGNLPSLQRVLGVVPLRPGTRAGFVLSRLRNTLTLTLRTDPRYLDREAARSLLAAFVGKVHDISRQDSLS